MNTGDFEFLRLFLEARIGLIIPHDKSFIMESRLMPVARKWKYPDVSGLVVALRGLPDPKLVRDMIDAMTQNESSFLRDVKTLRALRDDILPGFKKTHAGAKKLRIWCAACGSGQEPYMLAMLLEAAGFYDQGWKIELVATDVNGAQLEKARSARYSQFEVQRGLPIRFLVDYFTKDGASWKVKDTIAKRIEFREQNLLEPLSALGSFDLILCRNVLSQCSPTIRQDVLTRLGGQAGKAGWLVLSEAESRDVPGLWAEKGNGVYARA